MTLQSKLAGDDKSAKGNTDELIVAQVKPIIATAKPSLSSESALMRRLPSNLSGKTVQDVLSYMVGTEPTEDERPTVASLREQLGAAGSVIVINGKNAKLTDPVQQYLVDKSKDVGGKAINYQELEMEVSAVQQGGYHIRQHY